MPQKTPANSGRRATSGSYSSHHLHNLPESHLRCADISFLYATSEQSTDSLKESNASLIDECDRYRRRNERLLDKLSEKEEKLTKYEEKLENANRDLRHAKEEIKRLRAELTSVAATKETIEQGYRQLRYEKDTVDNNLIRLQASYDSLQLKYDAIPEERKNPMTTPMPERPKRSPGGASSATSGGSGGSSSRTQQESDRGRRRQAEKERLGARFESTRRPPPSAGNRSSYIEGFGSRRRSMSSSRAVYGDVAQTRFDEPLTSPRDSVTFSTVPRRIPSSNGYQSGGSSAAVDDDYEDGNYHLRPIH